VRPAPVLLTAHEVAQLLRVSHKTVYAWAKRGNLPSVKVGGKLVRFYESDIYAFIAPRNPGQKLRRFV